MSDFKYEKTKVAFKDGGVASKYGVHDIHACWKTHDCLMHIYLWIALILLISFDNMILERYFTPNSLEYVAGSSSILPHCLRWSLILRSDKLFSVN